MCTEVFTDMPFNGTAEVVTGFVSFSPGFPAMAVQFNLNRFISDHFLGIECDQPSDQIFQLAYVAGPVIFLEFFNRLRVNRLLRQAFFNGLSKEMIYQLRNVYLAVT